MTKNIIIMENDTSKGIVIDNDDVSEVPALPVATEGTTIDWEAEAKKYQGIATRRGTKLSKVKTTLETKPVVEAKADQGNKGVELDYGQKAFLIANGVKDADDMKFVQGVMKDSGRSLEDVLASAYTQGELKTRGEERATKAAMPNASDNRQGSPTRDTVDYWLAKGELPPADQVELRRKVVNAKIAKANSKSHFTKQSVVGSA